ncbi:MAG TPA: ABC transporter permease [Micromonosporaceae bacterium]|nr:ABC transporter permease [Micromonosporaceae bacterium]
MLVFTIRRLFQAIPILIVASIASFALATISGDPVQNKFLLRNPPPSAQVIATTRHNMRLDRPWLTQYWDWLSGLITRGDWGPSIDGIVIGSAVGHALIVTLRLIFSAILLALVLSLASGIVSAYRQYSKVDYSFTFVGFVFLAMPTFWIAALLKQGAIQFNNAWQSSFCPGDPTCRPIQTVGEQSIVPPSGFFGVAEDWFTHLLLPTLSLALITYAAWSRFVRASLLEVLNSDYVRLARAKGLTPRRVMFKHALRTSLIPMTTVTSLTIAGLFGGAIITERVFQWRGMGTLIINAINDKDRYVIMGWLVVVGFIVIVGNIIADILYAVLDPRIRYE